MVLERILKVVELVEKLCTKIYGSVVPKSSFIAGLCESNEKFHEIIWDFEDIAKELKGLSSEIKGQRARLAMKMHGSDLAQIMSYADKLAEIGTELLEGGQAKSLAKLATSGKTGGEETMKRVLDDLKTILKELKTTFSSRP